MADLKITDLTSSAAVTDTDLFPIVDDVGGTPVTKKLAASALKTYVSDTPTLATPNIGVATATSVNKLTLTQPATGATLTLVEGGSLITAGAYPITLTATASTGVTLPTTGTLATLAGAESLSNKTLVAPALGTPASGIMTNVTGTAASLTAGLATDTVTKTGTGSTYVTNTSPTLVTPALGAATAVSIVASGAISGGLRGNLGAAPTVASATTIAPTTAVVLVSGTTTIETITAPAPIATLGGTIVVIPTGVFLTGVTGNIALASTSVVSKALHMTYDPTTTKWYPSY